MGCNCSNLLGIKEDAAIENDNKINDDFFIDYSRDKIKNESNSDQNNDIIDINLDNEIYGSVQHTKESSATIRPIKSSHNLIKNENRVTGKYNKDTTFNIKEKYPNNCLYRSNTNKISKIKQNNNNNNLYSSEIEVKYSINFNSKIDNINPNEKPEDNFSCIIFDYINKLRTDPSDIANLIENSKKYIITEQNETIFKKNNIKISLNKGTSAFEEAINILKTTDPMNKILFNKNITIELPKTEEEIENLEFLQKKVDEIEKNGNIILSYWREKISDPEIAFIIMTVDDNPIETGLKRKDLLNSNMKYVGISSIKINKRFACYITLSK